MYEMCPFKDPDVKSDQSFATLIGRGTYSFRNSTTPFSKSFNEAHKKCIRWQHLTSRILIHLEQELFRITTMLIVAMDPTEANYSDS